MIEMVLVSLLFAVLLVGAAIWRLHEFPESISALVYLLKWPWLWTLWLWIVVLLITPAMIEAVGDGIAANPSCLARLLAISILSSYIAIWLELLEGIIDKLYSYIYGKIYPTADSSDDDAAGA